MTGEDRIARARDLYERLVFGGDPTAAAAADRELDAVEADLALARGRIMHGAALTGAGGPPALDPAELALFERAAELYHALGDGRGEAEALFWVATYHQVSGDESDRAQVLLERAYPLAEAAGDRLTLSYIARHLGFVEQLAGRLDAARARQEESVRLRREVGHMAGVAAGLQALAELAAEAGDRARALALLDEAAGIAEEAGARGPLRWIEATRAELAD